MNRPDSPDTALTTIYLVRHAHAVFSSDEERGLSATGTQDAHLLAERLATRPISAVYSSPHRRVVETVTPLAGRLGLRLILSPDLRERELPIVAADAFLPLVERTWRVPGAAVEGGESNMTAQARGLAVMRDVLRNHQGQHLVVGTHGNLLALILNGFDSAFGHEFWTQLTFPDVYQLDFEGDSLIGIERLWQAPV